MAMTIGQLREWLSRYGDDVAIGIAYDCLTLSVVGDSDLHPSRGYDYYEIGGWPLKDDDTASPATGLDVPPVTTIARLAGYSEPRGNGRRPADSLRCPECERSYGPRYAGPCEH